jgi:phospholipase A1
MRLSPDERKVEHKKRQIVPLMGNFLKQSKMTSKHSRAMSVFIVCIVIGISSLSLRAQTEVAEDDPGQKYKQQVLDACLSNASVSATVDKTIGQLRGECLKRLEGGLIDYRNILEEVVDSNPFAISPHRKNYILPLTYSKQQNDIYASQLNGETLDNVEVEFQISIKYLIAENILNENFDLDFGFTSISWWQTYNGGLSAPFRETNYEPELILSYNKAWSIFGLPFKSSFLSLNHQSNGQSGTLSRSWNRIISGLTFQHKDWVWRAEIWWRLPEDRKQSKKDARGDDNPNIERYVGQGQIELLWKSSRNHNLQLALRNNLRINNRGSLKLGWSFPLPKKLRGYLQLFNGYGESLVGYDRHSSRIGVGILLTDWL